MSAHRRSERYPELTSIDIETRFLVTSGIGSHEHLLGFHANFALEGGKYDAYQEWGHYIA